MLRLLLLVPCAALRSPTARARRPASARRPTRLSSEPSNGIPALPRTDKQRAAPIGAPAAAAEADYEQWISGQLRTNRVQAATTSRKDELVDALRRPDAAASLDEIGRRVEALVPRPSRIETMPVAPSFEMMTPAVQRRKNHQGWSSSLHRSRAQVRRPPRGHARPRHVPRAARGPRGIVASRGSSPRAVSPRRRRDSRKRRRRDSRERRRRDSDDDPRVARAGRGPAAGCHVDIPRSTETPRDL